MIRYQCEVCDHLKGPDNDWIFGFAAERVGITEARREITVVPKWDEMRARAALAVHFCSEDCKQEYMERLFGDVLPESGPISKQRAVRVVPKKRARSSARKNKRRAA